MDAAHDRSKLGCDVKPENATPRRGGYARVLDFRLTKLAGQGGGANV